MIGKLRHLIADNENVNRAAIKVVNFESVIVGNRDVTDNANKVLSQIEQVDESGKNPYAAGMKVTTGNEVKQLREDDEDAGGDDMGGGDDGDDAGGGDMGDDFGGDDGGDDAGGGDEGGDDAGGGDEGGDDAGDDEGGDDAGDDDVGDDDAGDDDAGDDEGGDDAGSGGEGGGEGGDDEGGELGDEEKTNLKDQYRQVFRQAMTKCEFKTKAFNQLTIEEKIKLLKQLKKIWGDKPEAFEFMSDNEIKQIEAIVIEPDYEGDNEGGDEGGDVGGDEGSEDEGSDEEG